MPTTDTERLATIEAAARKAAASLDPAHDALHLERVVSNVKLIVAADPGIEQQIDWLVLLAAAWLHDCVQLPKRDSQPGAAAIGSAEQARGILTSAGVDESRIEHICTAIEEHSFSAGHHPSSVESAVLQDADRLDALGAIGIARLWCVAANHQALLYDPLDPSAQERPLQDDKYALDHVQSKLLKLPAMMHTEPARAIARQRAAFIERYVATLLDEVGIQHD